MPVNQNQTRPLYGQIRTNLHVTVFSIYVDCDTAILQATFERVPIKTRQVQNTGIHCTQVEFQFGAALASAALINGYRSSTFDAMAASTLWFAQLFVMVMALLVDKVGVAGEVEVVWSAVCLGRNTAGRRR